MTKRYGVTGLYAAQRAAAREFDRIADKEGEWTPKEQEFYKTFIDAMDRQAESELQCSLGMVPDWVEEL